MGPSDQSALRCCFLLNKETVRSSAAFELSEEEKEEGEGSSPPAEAEALRELVSCADFVARFLWEKGERRRSGLRKKARLFVSVRSFRCRVRFFQRLKRSKDGSFNELFSAAKLHGVISRPRRLT